MAKQRKTRAQKVATAEKRSQFMYSFTPKTPVYVSTEKPTFRPAEVTVIHIKKDLTKTIFTSLFLVAAQIILLFLLQHHVVKIPGATY